VIGLPALSAGLASLAVSLAISVILTPMVRQWALRRDFVDHPSPDSGHKQHERATPLGGGIAITVAVLLPIVLALLAAAALHKLGSERLNELPGWVPIWTPWIGGIVKKTPQGLAVIFGALVMHLVGVVDDQRPLSPLLKLGAQVAVALLLTAGFGIRSAEALGAPAAVILTTLWIVALINAFNLLDNMDGLAAGVAGLTAIVLALSGFAAGQVFVPCMLLMMAGASVGFLVYNFPPASIFMGDAGSLVIGYLLQPGPASPAVRRPGAPGRLRDSLL
jgi:UDP-GlcNAc:undecaprenyl-phosphate GlcNAc-1-phosphate transferase